MKGSRPPARMKTILLIDDDENCRAPAAEMLRASQWHVLEADNGERGIELAIQHRPDVILCDLFMPRGNGFKVCRAVRDNFELRHTRIIVLSGSDYSSDREAAQEAGANDYLVKPLEFSKLETVLACVEAEPKITTPVNGSAASLPGEGIAQLRFWGVRGSIPTPGPATVHYGGNTSCIEVRADGELVVLDAGSGIRPLGLALAEEFKETPLNLTLLISHTHWDHIQGFPFFLPAYNPQNRVRILGYEGARAGLASTLAGQMESPYFPIALKQMPGNIVIEELGEMNFRLGNIRVEACFLNHPGVCVGYRLNTSSGSIVYVPDNEWSIESGVASKSAAVPCRIEQGLADFVRDADVLVIDAQYDRSEYDHHVGWGHGCVDDVVKLAVAANVKQLFLFHHDPAHDDAYVTRMLENARAVAKEMGGALQIEAAREGAEVILGSRKARN
ncbi:MAG: response regulator, partial [Verrucomicrobiaceae bacterium]